MNNNSDLAPGFDMLGRVFDSRPHITIVEVATPNNSSEVALVSDTLGRGFDFRYLLLNSRDYFAHLLLLTRKHKTILLGTFYLNN